MALTKVTYSMIDGAWTNVLDFGADNTGATDTSAAIQTAINASSGKILYFPEGTYKINSPVVANVHDITIDFGGAVITNTVVLPTITVAGLSINPIIYLQGNDITVKNGLFSELVSQGIRIEGDEAGGANPYRDANYIKNPMVIGTNFYNCVQSYLQIRFFSQAVIDNIVVTTNDTMTPNDGGASIGASYGSGCSITNCSIDDGLGGKTMYALYVSNIKYSNCALNPLNKQVADATPSFFMAYCINGELSGCSAYLYGNNAVLSPSCVKIDRGENIIINNCDFFSDSSGTYAYAYSGVQIQGTDGFSVCNNRIKARNARSALLIYPHVGANATGGIVSGNYLENTETVATSGSEGSCLYAIFNTGNTRKPLSITGNQLIGGNAYIQQAQDLKLSDNEIITNLDPYSTYASVHCLNVINAFVSDNFVNNKDATTTKIGIYVSGTFINLSNNNVQFNYPAITGSTAYQTISSTSCQANYNYYVNAATKYDGFTVGNGWTVNDI